MKQITHFFAAIAALLSVFSSCVGKTDVIIEDSDINSITITAYYDGASETRTAVINGGAQVLWHPNDEIKLFAGTQSSKLVSNNSDFAAVSEFSGSAPGPVSLGVIGLYPYSDEASCDGKSVTVDIPSNQIAEHGSFSRNTFVTMGYSETNQMHFKSVCGGLRFSLGHSDMRRIKRIVLEGCNGEAIAGKVQVAIVDDEPQVQSVINTPLNNRIILTAPQGGTFQESKWYYIVMIPQVLENGFKLTFYSDDTVGTIRYASPVTIKRGVFGSIERIVHLGYQMSENTSMTEYGEQFTPVDLGLSVKWADKNIGARYPHDYGDYYAWGETETKDFYDWSTYKWCNGSVTSLIKYNGISDLGVVDNLAELQMEDDVAHVNLGGAWRIPNAVDVIELMRTKNDSEHYLWSFKTIGGHKGWEIVYLDNGNSIFLPLAGMIEYNAPSYNGRSVYFQGTAGYYTCASLYLNDCVSVGATPYFIWAKNDGVCLSYGSASDRSWGKSVRPVYDTSQIIN